MNYRTRLHHCRFPNNVKGGGLDVRPTTLPCETMRTVIKPNELQIGRVSQQQPKLKKKDNDSAIGTWDLRTVNRPGASMKSRAPSKRNQSEVHGSSKAAKA